MNTSNLHKYDVSLNIEQHVQNIDRATYFQDKKDDLSTRNDWDCMGCLGTAGTAGGTFGCFGTLGCCC